MRVNPLVSRLTADRPKPTRDQLGGLHSRSPAPLAVRFLLKENLQVKCNNHYHLLFRQGRGTHA